MAEVRQVELDDRDRRADLPPVSLDAGRYRRAAANILSNALKFSRRGGDVIVARRASRTSTGKSWLVLRVADSGPGVPESVKDRLGGPYQRFTGSERIPGTGLGLTVVGAVAVAHGGCIQVEPRRARRRRLRLLALGPGVKELHAGRHLRLVVPERLGVRRASRHPRHRRRRRRDAGGAPPPRRAAPRAGATRSSSSSPRASPATPGARRGEPLEEAARRELVEETGLGRGGDGAAHGRSPVGGRHLGDRHVLPRPAASRGSGRAAASTGEAITTSTRSPSRRPRRSSREREAAGVLVDPKVWAGLWFAAPPLTAA